jgi:DnaJ-class molecular chaperone
MLDHSIYSYTQLKTAYLEAVHKLHPDKNNHVHSHEKESAKSRFVELKEAWQRYEDIAKTMRRVEKGDNEASSFTMFGVGCSFSDTDEERAKREEIMNQACRGWFSSGALGNGEEEVDQAQTTFSDVQQVSLSHDDYFVPHDDMDAIQAEEEPKRPDKPRNFLVGHLIRPSRNRD